MSVKRDILGRELHDNDLVVIKGSGGYESAAKPMEVGVFIGKSVRTMTATRTARDMFLIENPGAMEMHLKNTILKKIADEKAASNAKKVQKNKQQANVVGGVYKMTQYEEVLVYCGKKIVTIYKNGSVMSQEEGHLYISAGKWMRDTSTVPRLTFDDFIKEETKMLASYGQYHSCYVLKSPKKYSEAFHVISVPDAFQWNGTHQWKEGGWNGVGPASGMKWIEHNDEYVVVVDPV